MVGMVEAVEKPIQEEERGEKKAKEAP